MSYSSHCEKKRKEKEELRQIFLPFLSSCHPTNSIKARNENYHIINWQHLSKTFTIISGGKSFR